MQYSKHLYRYAQKVRDLFKTMVTPATCVYCTEYLLDQNKFLCYACNSMIKPLATMSLKLTDAYQAAVYAVSDYKDPLRSLVLAKQSRQKLAAEQLGVLVWEKTDVPYAEFDYIVPVPLHWSRYAWRWFNQAEVMAQAIAQKSGKPVIHLVRRVVQTPSQAGLSRVERLKNMQDAFVLCHDAHRYKNARLLFVDDVMTTGTTLQAVIKKSLVLQPQKLLIAVACRVV